MDRLTFYFDRNFGRRLPEALYRANPPFDVEFHHSPKWRFSPTTIDDEWLSIIGPQGWFAFSHDRKWHKELPALAAIRQHKIGCFYLWGAEATTWDKVCFFVRHYERIIETANSTVRPFVFDVTKTGEVARVDLSEIDLPMRVDPGEPNPRETSEMAVQKRPQGTQKPSEPELHHDAWKRFEKMTKQVMTPRPPAPQSEKADAHAERAKAPKRQRSK
jgi:hypothetical protein